jgi:hypothetical protein
VVDQLANEYTAADQSVIFLEQNVDQSLGDRADRWWAAHGGGSVSLPLVMVDSGQQFSNGYLSSSAHDTYKAMVDTALARPPQAEIMASSRRLADRVYFDRDMLRSAISDHVRRGVRDNKVLISSRLGGFVPFHIYAAC